MRLVLFQPDIAPNVGTMLRLCACLGVPIDLIEPLGFLMDGPRLRRSALDYLAAVDLTRHRSFAHFRENRPSGRLVLLTTRAASRYHETAFRPDDQLLVGRETAGVPDEVHAIADLRVRIPMRDGLRSLNVAVAAAIVLAEALRQTDQWPEGSENGGIQS